MRLFSCFFALGVLLLLQACGPPRPGIKRHEFTRHAGDTCEAELGTFLVRENRGDPESRTVPLRFECFKSTAEKPGHPIVYLAGSPVGSGIEAAAGPSFALDPNVSGVLPGVLATIADLLKELNRAPKTVQFMHPLKQRNSPGVPDGRHRRSNRDDDVPRRGERRRICAPQIGVGRSCSPLTVPLAGTVYFSRALSLSSSAAIPTSPGYEAFTRKYTK